LKIGKTLGMALVQRVIIEHADAIWEEQPQLGGLWITAAEKGRDGLARV
jgi:hypothetical protein